MTKLYVVKQYVDTLNTQPTLSAPMELWEAEDTASEWLMETMEHIVQHSPYAIDDEEYNSLYEHETMLIRIEEHTTC